MSPRGGRGPSKEELEEKRIKGKKKILLFKKIQKQKWGHSPAVSA